MWVILSPGVQKVWVMRPI